MTSYNPMAWVVKRAKLNFKKVFFWNTLVLILDLRLPDKLMTLF